MRTSTRLLLSALTIACVHEPSQAAERYLSRQTLTMPKTPTASATPAAAPATPKLSCPSTPTNRYPYINQSTAIGTSSFATSNAAQAVAWANTQPVTGTYALFSFNGSIAVLFQTNVAPVFFTDATFTSKPDQGWYVCSTR